MSEIVQVCVPWHPGHYTYRNALVQHWVKGFKQHAFFEHPWMYLNVEH